MSPGRLDEQRANNSGWIVNISIIVNLISGQSVRLCVEEILFKGLLSCQDKQEVLPWHLCLHNATDTWLLASLAITGRKEEINSKYSMRPPSLTPPLPLFLNVFISFPKLELCGHSLQTIVPFLCIFPLVVVRNEWQGKFVVLHYPTLQ